MKVTAKGSNQTRLGSHPDYSDGISKIRGIVSSQIQHCLPQLIGAGHLEEELTKICAILPEPLLGPNQWERRSVAKKRQHVITAINYRKFGPSQVRIFSPENINLIICWVFFLK